MNAYEEKQAAKKARQAERAAKIRAEADATYQQARKMAEVIPFGQPILIGHYSEKSDRAYRGRIHNKFGKAFALMDQAKELQARAETTSNAISSDDPDAVKKLETKLDGMKSAHARMVAANKCIRKGDDAGLAAIGYDAGDIERLKKPDLCGRVGFANYALQNSSANIRRVELRIKQLQRKSGAEKKETEYQGFCKVVEDPTENRVMLVFPDKPELKVREILKGHGFRWSPTRTAWVRMLNNAGRYAAECVMKKLTEVVA